MTHTDSLLTALRDAPRERKAPPLIALMERSSKAKQIAHIIGELKNCGKQTHTGFTAAGKKRTGRMRCKLPICPRCQVREAKKQSSRAQALMAAATWGSPEREYFSLVTINADHKDGRRFRRELVKACRGSKFTGVLSVSMSGRVHAHLAVRHEQTARADLKDHLKSCFPADRAVHTAEIEQDWALDGIDNFIRYAHQPIKGRDAIRSPEAWSVEGLAEWAELNVALSGPRKIEGGFTKVEKIKAKSLLKSFKPKCVKRTTRKLTSVLLNQLSKAGNVPLTQSMRCEAS